jgi:hypothetical protein
MAGRTGSFPDMKADSFIKGTGKAPVAESSMTINGTTTSISETMTTIAGSSRRITSTLFGVLVLTVLSFEPAFSQSPSPDSPANQTSSSGQQPKRILGIIPNYRAVSADTEPEPQSTKDKFKLATQDSFDYSSFILAGITAGVGQVRKSTPEFGQGAGGYGQYYWHSFADEVSGNYLTEAIVPAVFREDPRYYTLGHGNFFHRTGYALSRLVITKTDSDHKTFNFSEILGNGASAGVSNFYYPEPERTWIKTRQRWAAQVGLDGVFNIFKEFWPDISSGLLHQHGS